MRRRPLRDLGKDAHRTPPRLPVGAGRGWCGGTGSTSGSGPPPGASGAGQSRNRAPPPSKASPLRRGAMLSLVLASLSVFQVPAAAALTPARRSAHRRPPLDGGPRVAHGEPLPRRRSALGLEPLLPRSVRARLRAAGRDRPGAPRRARRAAPAAGMGTGARAGVLHAARPRGGPGVRGGERSPGSGRGARRGAGVRAVRGAGRRPGRAGARATPRAFDARIRAKLPELEPLAEDLARLFGGPPPTVPVYLLANPATSTWVAASTAGD